MLTSALRLQAPMVMRWPPFLHDTGLQSQYRQSGQGQGVCAKQACSDQERQGRCRPHSPVLFCHASRTMGASTAGNQSVYRPLVRRIDALISMRTQEMNRIDVSHESIKSSIRESYHVSGSGNLGTLKRTDCRTHKRRPGTEKRRRTLLKSIPGIGEATIAAILAELHMFEKCDQRSKDSGIHRACS